MDYQELAIRLQQETLADRLRADSLWPIAVDGKWGHASEEALASVAWGLGLDVSGEIDHARVIGMCVGEVEPSPAEQKERAARRRNIGALVQPEDQIMGVGIVDLVLNWSSWINRRVETLSFEPDEHTVRRVQSVDFDSGRTFAPPRRWNLDAGTSSADVTIAPLALVNKWRLRNFSLEDEAGRTLPLLTKQQHGTISAATLMAFAYAAADEPPPPAETLMPREIEEDLRAIANETPDRAIAVWTTLGQARVQSPDVVRWRKALAESEPFMGLAFDVARMFFLTPALVSTGACRRIVRFSYDARGRTPPNTARRRRRRTGRVEKREAARRRRRSESGTHKGVGQLRIDLDYTHKGVTDDGPPRRALIDSLFLCRPDGTEEPLRWVGEHCWAPPLVPGTYKVIAKAARGCAILNHDAQKVEIELGRMSVVEFRVREVRRQVDHGSVSRRTPPTGLVHRIARGMGWASRQIVVPTKLGHGGSFHVELVVPPGLQITRGRLVAASTGLLDTVLETSQRVHLYVAGEVDRPATGFAQFNVRPREETVIRASLLTAWASFFVLLGLAYHWHKTGEAVRQGAALALAVPGALAAFAAQRVDDIVVNAVVYGLRLWAILPAALAFGAAFLVAGFPKEGEALTVLYGLCGVALLVALIFTNATRYTRSPPEQAPTVQAQGPEYANLEAT